MAAFLHDDILDAALSYISTNTENLYICSAQPTTYAEAQTTYKLGTKASPSFGSLANGDVSGRKLPVNAISDGVVNSNGNAKWVALCDNSASKLLATQELNAYKDIVTGSPFTLTAFDIEFPDPTT
jgi:hypothetical protein